VPLYYITRILYYVLTLCYIKNDLLYYIMLYYVILCYVVLRCVTLCYVVLRCIVLRCVTLCYVVLCCAVLCCAVLCYIMLYYIILYIILYYIILYYIILYYVILLEHDDIFRRGHNRMNFQIFCERLCYFDDKLILVYVGRGSYRKSVFHSIL